MSLRFCHETWGCRLIALVVVTSEFNRYAQAGCLEELETRGRQHCECSQEPDSLVPLRGAVPDKQAEMDALLRQISAMDKRLLPMSEQDTCSMMAHSGSCLFCDAREVTSSLKGPLGPVFGRQLFADDYLIESASAVERVLATPVTQRISMPENSRTFGFVASVTHDGQQFMMHYRAAANTLGVATSSDGFNWKKQKTSLDINRGGEQCVLLDKFEKNMQHLYKIAYNSKNNKSGVSIATSPDGMHWTSYRLKVMVQPDTQPCLYRDTEDTFLLVARKEYGLKNADRAIRGIVVLRVDASTFMISLLDPNQLIPFEMVKEWYFGKFGTLERYRRQPYAMTRTLYEGVYFGFIHLFQWPWPDRGCPSQNGKKNIFCNKGLHKFEKGRMGEGVVDALLPYLATSRDGLRYNFGFVYNNQQLPLFGKEQDSIVIPAGHMITREGFHWVYFSSQHQTHHNRWDSPGAISLARFQQDRISGLTPRSTLVLGNVTTRQFYWPQDTKTVKLNADLQAKSSLSVYLLAAGGRQRTQLAEMVGSSKRNGATMLFGTGGIRETGYVQLQFLMKGEVVLYAFQLA